jgi:hypothetical protein
LLNWAGYEPVSKIAQRLGRSVRAVRFRLGALGMSARVTDGWSQREIRKLLRVSPARLRYLIGAGMLRVRDPRITTNSMLMLCRSNGLLLDHSALEHTVTLSKLAACPWERAAELLGIAAEEIQTLICKGTLKVADPFVTERSFEEFCRKHGDQINMSLIDRATARWLVEEYGVSTASRALSPAQKHAMIVRACKCGRKIAGNVFFKHVKHCPTLNEERMGRPGEFKTAVGRPTSAECKTPLSREHPPHGSSAIRQHSAAWAMPTVSRIPGAVKSCQQAPASLNGPSSNAVNGEPMHAELPARGLKPNAPTGK